MACDSGYLAPSDRERESRIVLELLREVRGLNFNHEYPLTPIYGDELNLDLDTATLCDWCQRHDITRMSLELQLWWQRHQRHDEARHIQEHTALERFKRVQEALDKLTPEERVLLGLDKA